MEVGHFWSASRGWAMRPPGLAARLVLLAVLWAAGCDSSEQVQSCVRGSQRQCTCADGSTSFAICLATGMWGPCQCGDATTGAGASSAPTSGTGGAWQTTGGSAASSGSAATGAQPLAGSGGSVQPAAGSGGDLQPIAGSPSGQPTAGLGAEDAGPIEVPVDGGTGDGGPGTADAGPQPQDGGTDAGPNPNQNEVPATAYCEPVADWDPAWAAWEEEVVVLTNQHRAQGADCTSGSYPPAEPLTMNPSLRCAARVHSMDMALRDFYDHYTPEGISPFQRMADAGYPGGMAENISMGQSSPQEAVQGWMDSDGHCVNIMRSNLTEIGVGYYDGSTPGQWPPKKMWTQTFGGSAWGGP